MAAKRAPRTLRRTAPFSTLQELGRVLYAHVNEFGPDDPLFAASQYYLEGERPPHALEVAADQEVGSLYEAWRKNYGKPGSFWTKKDGRQLWRAFITLAILTEFSPRRRDPSRLTRKRKTLVIEPLKGPIKLGPKVISKRTTHDGMTVTLWEDGQITDRLGRYRRGYKLPLKNMWRAWDDIGLYTYDEIPVLVNKARTGK